MRVVVRRLVGWGITHWRAWGVARLRFAQIVGV
jgi:hypothetical protein